MNAPGRPKREYRSAQHAGSPMSAPGRPKRELLPLGGTARSAKGVHSRPPGRPKGEHRSAQHEGSPVRPMGRAAGTRRPPARLAPASCQSSRVTRPDSPPAAPTAYTVETWPAVSTVPASVRLGVPVVGSANDSVYVPAVSSR